jgi:hypothetical protein
MGFAAVLLALAGLGWWVRGLGPGGNRGLPFGVGAQLGWEAASGPFLGALACAVLAGWGIRTILANVSD